MVVAHGVEMAVAVAKVADMTWCVVERHRDYTALTAAEAKDVIVAEDALEHERKENLKLQAAIELYETALMTELKRHGSQQSLRELFSHSNVCSLDLYEQLKRRVASPAFLHSLKCLPYEETSSSSKPTVMKTEDGVFVNTNMDDPNWWLWVSENDLFTVDHKEKDGLDAEGYVFVNQEDFVDGIASFLARYISSMPQAKRMSPKELQDTILKAFTKVEKKGKIRKAWETGKLIYTATSWGATVLGMYRHPIVLRAASMAVWTTCCLILQLLK